MEKHLLIIALASVGLVGLLAGCSTTTTSMNGSTYTGAQLQQGGHLAEGTVLQVRNVIADRAADSSSNAILAGGLGAVVGGALGHKIGGGTGKKVATTLGAAAGAVGASELAKAGQKVAAWEIIVRLDIGKAMSVTQEADAYALQAGQRVYVLAQGGRYRVVPAIPN